MARIRTIKPEYWQDEKVGKLSLPARLLFIGMWNFADDCGVVRGHPVFLRSQIFPYDDFTKAEIESWIDEIKNQGMISVFVVNTENFYQISNFLKHQIINRPSKNLNPKPDQSRINHGTITDQSLNDHGTITDQSLNNHGTITDQSLNNHGTITDGVGVGVGVGSKERIKAFCPAPKKTGAEPEAENIANLETIFEIPILGNNGKNTYHITQPMINDWQTTYPAVDVKQALGECRQWNIANPTRRKTSSGIARHVVSWLQREQNSGGTAINCKRASPPGLMKGQSKTYEHNVAAISQAMFELQQEEAATG